MPTKIEKSFGSSGIRLPSYSWLSVTNWRDNET